MATFNGTSGDDIFTGGIDSDSASGFEGNDSLVGNGGSDTLIGGQAATQLDGGDGDDQLLAGNPQVRGYYSYYLDFDPATATYSLPVLDDGQERDVLRGGSGSDILSAGYGDDVDGGSPRGGSNFYENDTLNLSLKGSPTGLTIDFGKAPLVIGGGTITNIETIGLIYGTDFADNFTFPTTFGNGGDTRRYLQERATTSSSRAPERRS